MEFIEGETFASMIERRGPIPSQETLPLFRQALLGLGYAHRMGIVHRDIKPGNMMLSRQGIVKVMDFGIAKVLGGRSMTRTGTQMGTAWYMAPEQVVNRGVDIRSDIYALGITLYEMLSGHVPFESDSDYQVMADHVNTPPPPPTQFYPYIPAGVVNAVLKALAKDPNARFQTTEEFGAALENPDSFVWTPAAVAAAAGAAVAAPMGQQTAPLAAAPLAAPVEVQPPPPPKPWHAWTTLPRVALLGLGVVVLAGAGVYLKLHPPFHPKTPDVVTTLAPIASGTTAPGAGNTAQVEIPPVPVPSPAPADASTTAGTSGQTPTGDTAPQKPSVQNPPTRRRQQEQSPPSPPTAQSRHQAAGSPTEYTPSPQPPLASQPAQVIPAGTTIAVRTTDVIDSAKNYRGQKCSASVDTTVLVGGKVVVPRGTEVQLEVVEAADSGPFRGRAALQLRLVALAVHGRFQTVDSDLFLREGAARVGTGAAVIGGAAAVGGVIGGVFRRKRGAAEGAAVGAGAGAAAEETTRGKVQIPSETRIEFHLQTAVTVP